MKTLPAKFAPAVTAALAEGGEVVDFRLPMGDPPPKNTHPRLVLGSESTPGGRWEPIHWWERGKSILFEAEPFGVGRQRRVFPPLLPGEVYRVEELGSVYGQDAVIGYTSVRILTATPERWCEEGCVEGHKLVPFECCDDEGCQVCGGAGGDAVAEECPACQGEPGWSRWLYTARREVTNKST